MVFGEETQHVSVRLVSATNQNLSALIEQKKVREDLYYRLSVVPIRVPPLCERPEDLHPLAEYLLEEFCHRNNLKPKRIEPEVYDSLRDYRWPGNVRVAAASWGRVGFETRPGGDSGIHKPSSRAAFLPRIASFSSSGRFSPLMLATIFSRLPIW